MLDTWFSSALWPFSTLGWPEQTPELARYYPGDVLVTGFDIIFFWVARMMMMGQHFMGEVPFHTVYIHALVRDEHGQKMSKAKGNIVDPLDLIDKYGCDALRFTLAAFAAPWRDVKMAESRVEGYRNFATKLWNAARFCQVNECRLEPGFDPASCRQQVNRWAVGRIAALVQRVDRALAEYKFNEAAHALYHGVWGEFCDWYLEFAKPIIGKAEGESEDTAAAGETRAAIAWALGQLLHLLHPFMPFITEELWQQALGGDNPLIVAPWPSFLASLIDGTAMAELDWVIELVSAIRTLRAEYNVSPAAVLDTRIRDAGPKLDRHLDLIQRLARVVVRRLGAPLGVVQMVVGGATVMLSLAGHLDIDREAARIQKEIDRCNSEVTKAEKKLANADFVAKAPAEVVEELSERLADELSKRDKLRIALERLKNLNWSKKPS